MKIRSFLLICSSVAIALLNCSPTAVSTGNGSETVAEIHGRIVTPEGVAASNAVVRLIPANFNPVSQGDVGEQYRCATDENGVFSFLPKIKNTVQYNLEIKEIHYGLSRIHMNVIFINDTADFHVDTVSMPGAVTLRIPAGISEGYVLMRGTTRSATIDAAALEKGTILLDSIPSGTVAPVEYSPLSKPPATVLISDTMSMTAATMVVRGNIVIYKDNQSLLTGTWVNPPECSFAEDSFAPAYEGTKSYRFDYLLDTVFGYAGAGMDLDNWWNGATYDLSRCSTISVVYKGLSQNHGICLQLRDPDAVSNNVHIGGVSDTFTLCEVPLTAFIDVDLSQIREVIFGIVDSTDKSGTATGTVWIDDVEINY